MVLNFTPLIISGTLLGMGLGALLVDGILFHQILQIHNMFSAHHYPSTVENAKMNMFYDGLFHAFTWLLTVMGIAALWASTGRKAVPRSSRALLGSMVLGFGVFNLIEGLIDHHVLDIHHVVELAPQRSKLLWDLAFLLFGGVLMIWIGWYQVRLAKTEMNSM